MIKSKKKGLGKGLSALFGDTNLKSQKEAKSDKSEAVKDDVKTALIGDLSRNPFQPRVKFDEDNINELSKSIKQNLNHVRENNYFSCFCPK